MRSPIGESEVDAKRTLRLLSEMVHSLEREDELRTADEQMRRLLKEDAGGGRAFFELAAFVRQQRAFWIEEIRDGLPRLLRSAEGGDVWAAVCNALWIGRAWGSSDPTRDQIAYDKLHRQAADAARGRQTVKSASEGGKRRRKVPDAMVLRDKVYALLERNAHLSRAQACRLVGSQYGVTGRSIERHLAALRR